MWAAVKSHLKYQYDNHWRCNKIHCYFVISVLVLATLCPVHGQGVNVVCKSQRSKPCAVRIGLQVRVRVSVCGRVYIYTAYMHSVLAAVSLVV